MTTAAVPALRATWRRSAEHFAEQVKRFLRLTALAALPSIVNLIQGGRFDWRTLLAFVLPFAEVAYREVFPALGAAAADTAPGVTIVPAQVGILPSAPADAMPDPDGADPGVLTGDAGHGDVASLGYLIVALVLVLIVLRIFHLV